MSEPMWEYWRDKKGHIEALEEQYPEILKSDVELRIIINMIKCGLGQLDVIMKAKGV